MFSVRVGNRHGTGNGFGRMERDLLRSLSGMGELYPTYLAGVLGCVLYLGKVPTFAQKMRAGI